MTPKLRYAREIVKLALTKQGVKLSYVTSHNITKAAKEMLKECNTWDKLRSLRASVAKRPQELME